jgi:hypothetical protein
MTTSECINYDELLQTNNSYWIGIEIDKLSVLKWLMDNLDHPECRAIYILYREEDNSNISYRISKLWNEITNKDYGCSNTNEHCYEFLQQYLIKCMEHNQRIQRSAIDDKIANLRQEIKQLQSLKLKD